MRKLILAVLMVAMVTTPCLAQEVEPEGIFSLQGTRWNYITGTMITPFPFRMPIAFNEEIPYGFYDGEVYPYLIPTSKSFYVDLFIVSIFAYEQIFTDPLSSHTWTERGFGILHPIGIGRMIVCQHDTVGPFERFLGMLLMIRTDDKWIPPDPEPEVE